MVVIGGQDFTDKNDLFMLDLESYEWIFPKISGISLFENTMFHS